MKFYSYTPNTSYSPFMLSLLSRRTISGNVQSKYFSLGGRRFIEQNLICVDNLVSKDQNVIIANDNNFDTEESTDQTIKSEKDSILIGK